VDLNPAWMMKGQHWRIEKELTSRILGATAEAERLRADIEDLRQRVTDATRRIAEPFPQAGELEASRARRDAIEQAIRDAAAPTENGDGDPATSHDLAIPEASVPPDVTRLADSQEIIHFGPATVWPGISAPDAAKPSHSPEPVRTDGEPEPVDGHGLSYQTPDRWQPYLPPPAVTVARPLEEQLPIDGIAPPEPPTGTNAQRRQRSRHPAAVARADWTAEPLFAVPDPEPVPDASHRNRRRAPRRRARRTPAQIAARDSAVQVALFDVPKTGLPPSRRTASSRGRPQQPRK
jgi:hypothetical protein